eukprot:1159948-Pelagomonas_calceolata.AAC.3
MRSALTQSLVSGKPSEPQGTKPSRTLGHAFPCIAYGAGEDDASERSLSPASSDTHISQALDALELDKLELVGSAPSAGLEGLTLDGKRLVRVHTEVNSPYSTATAEPVAGLGKKHVLAPVVTDVRTVKMTSYAQKPPSCTPLHVNTALCSHVHPAL